MMGHVFLPPAFVSFYRTFQLMILSRAACKQLIEEREKSASQLFANWQRLFHVTRAANAHIFTLTKNFHSEERVINERKFSGVARNFATAFCSVEAKVFMFRRRLSAAKVSSFRALNALESFQTNRGQF